MNENKISLFCLSAKSVAWKISLKIVLSSPASGTYHFLPLILHWKDVKNVFLCEEKRLIDLIEKYKKKMT